MPQMSVYSLGLQSEQLSNIDGKILNISAIWNPFYMKFPFNLYPEIQPRFNISFLSSFFLQVSLAMALSNITDQTGS